MTRYTITLLHLIMAQCKVSIETKWHKVCDNDVIFKYQLFLIIKDEKTVGLLFGKPCSPCDIQTEWCN